MSTAVVNQTSTAVKLLETTQSVCPECLKVLPAQIVVRDNAVFMDKECSDHGCYSTYLWPDEEHYLWLKKFKFPHVAPEKSKTSTLSCPDACGLCSHHRHHPRLVEIELTQRCNLRCPVCFMAADGNQSAIDTDLSLEIIKAQLESILEQSGANTSIQLTGGEPTVRDDLPQIVRMCREVGFSAIEVNTNGVVISQNPAFLQELIDAGITGIYMQFDGLTDDVFRKVRGANLVKLKRQAIENCRAAGIQVVLAMAVISGTNEDQMGDVLRFALENRDVIAGVAYQPAFGSGRFDVNDNLPLTMGDVIFKLSEQSDGIVQPYDFWPTGCSHPLCDSTTYVVRTPEGFSPVSRKITVAEYLEHFDPTSPQGSVMPDIAARMYPDIEPGVSILIMNYMDADSMDLQRLQQCSMTVAGPEGRLVPFCSYQLTNCHGQKHLTF